MTLNEQHYYLKGFQEGTSHLGLLSRKFDPSSTSTPLPDAIRALDLSPTQRQGIAAVIRDARATVSPERFGDVAGRVMTDLYKDAANAFIPFSFMLEIALLRIEGKSEAEIGRELEIRRQVFGAEPAARK